jgi:hypothetical protein
VGNNRTTTRSGPSATSGSSLDRDAVVDGAADLVEELDQEARPLASAASAMPFSVMMIGRS